MGQRIQGRNFNFFVIYRFLILFSLIFLEGGFFSEKILNLVSIFIKIV